ncbi:MAG: hypothetical protein KDC73_02855 [Ignavibacteriae bacterium]|nr:hypothetical protein [Ignavibacteriota bacterium]MCB0723614.1 hypothetical protein [Ignavibacteriota bacterium]MCB9244341.1 hypothetical protein [Ignavibacteriales bacterium]
MITFLKKYKFVFGGLFLGLIGGFMYWNFVGCSNGQCAIQSNAYLMSAYGAVVGVLVGNIVQSFGKS